MSENPFAKRRDKIGPLRYEDEFEVPQNSLHFLFLYPNNSSIFPFGIAQCPFITEESHEDLTQTL